MSRLPLGIAIALLSGLLFVGLISVAVGVLAADPAYAVTLEGTVVVQVADDFERGSSRTLPELTPGYRWGTAAPGKGAVLTYQLLAVEFESGPGSHSRTSVDFQRRPSRHAQVAVLWLPHRTSGAFPSWGYI